MHSDQQHLYQNTKLPLADQVGSGYIPNPPIGSFFGQNVDLHPSKICPRNFIIFDRTDNRSQIMYHPAVGPGIGYPDATYIENSQPVRNKENAPPREVHSVIKEDSADIDLLLSFEDEDDYEGEEELSTARTYRNDTSDTADSCSSRSRKSSRLGLSSFSHKSSGSSERKREKMRKMVNSLRGIVPGGNRMNTVAVIDEAVKYLKSLKVELQKVSVANLKN